MVMAWLSIAAPIAQQFERFDKNQIKLYFEVFSQQSVFFLKRFAPINMIGDVHIIKQKQSVGKILMCLQW